MKAKDFALQHYSKKAAMPANEIALRRAIENGQVTPDMSLREIGKAVGIDNPQLVRHYLMKFLKEEL